MNNIIDVEFCKVQQVIEQIRKQTNRTCKPKYSFVLELLFTERNIALNTILQDMDNKNTFCVTNKSNGLYICKMISCKRRNGIRKPKKLIVLSAPIVDIKTLVSDKTEHLQKTEICDKIDLGLDMNSLEKQINEKSDMLCLVYDDSNKMYCDLLKSNVSDNYDMRIIVKKK